MQLVGEKRHHRRNTRIATLFREHRVVGLGARRKLDGYECFAEHIAQRLESAADEAILRIFQPEHLATVGGALHNAMEIIG